MRNSCFIPMLVIPMLLAYSGTAHALTGKQFVSKCDPDKLSEVTEGAQNSLDKAVDLGSCTGFAGGVLNGANLVGSMLRKQGAMERNFICLQGDTHALGLVKLSVDHIRDDENLLALPAQAGIFQALLEAYPCNDE